MQICPKQQQIAPCRKLVQIRCHNGATNIGKNLILVTTNPDRKGENWSLQVPRSAKFWGSINVKNNNTLHILYRIEFFRYK